MWAEGAKYRLPLSKRRREGIEVDDSGTCIYMSPVNTCQSAGACVWLLFLINFSPKTTTHPTRLFYFLSGFSSYSAASPKVCFFFHLLHLFFSFTRKKQAHAGLDRLGPTLPHTSLVAPAAFTVFGLRQLIYFLAEAGPRCMCRAASAGGAE